MNYVKLLLLNQLLIWYRRKYTKDVEDVITPLDELINEVAMRLSPRRELCRRHYFSSEAFKDCPDCGWSSDGLK